MTMSERLTPEEQQTLSKTILEANEQGWGIALGLLFGVWDCWSRPTCW